MVCHAAKEAIALQVADMQNTYPADNLFFKLL